MTIDEIKKGLEENPELKNDLVALVETDAIEHLKNKLFLSERFHTCQHVSWHRRVVHGYT